MLAMVLNDYAGSLAPRGVLWSIASMLAPTVSCSANLMLVQQPVEGRSGYPQHLGGNAQVVAVAV
jgi:hypothetical protein